MQTTVSNSIEVSVAISAREFLLLYKGVARNVVATAVDGRSVKFPAKILQGFVTREGVHGRFRIVFSATGQFQSITRLE